MSLKRGSVLGVLVLLPCAGRWLSRPRRRETAGTTVSAIGDHDAEPRPRAREALSALRRYRSAVNALIAQLEQSKQKIAQLEAALNAEISARQAADGVLQNNINAIVGRWGNPGRS